MKILKRDVQRAEARWADCATRWGDDNLATIRALMLFRELREQWERQTGRPYR